MVYKNISIATIIAKIFRDLNLQSENWIDDSIEWIGEALQFISAPAQFSKKSNVLTVSGHRTQVPIDLMVLQAIFFNEASSTTDYHKLPMIYPVRSSGSLSHSGMHSNVHGEGYFPDSPDETYQISDGWIYTSFDEGKIAIIYYAFPCDDDGFPLVPDNQSFKEALMWYIVKKLMLSGWNHSNPEITYTFAESRWLKYCTQARNQAQMPDMQRMEQFAKTWVVTAGTDRYINNFANRLSNVEITQALEYRHAGSSTTASNINVNSVAGNNFLNVSINILATDAAFDENNNSISISAGSTVTFRIDTGEDGYEVEYVNSIGEPYATSSEDHTTNYEKVITFLDPGVYTVLAHATWSFSDVVNTRVTENQIEVTVT